MTVMLLCDSVVVKTTGERSAGKPHAAFDEGDLGEPWSLLYRSLRKNDFFKPAFKRGLASLLLKLFPNQFKSGNTIVASRGKNSLQFFNKDEICNINSRFMDNPHVAIRIQMKNPMIANG